MIAVWLRWWALLMKNVVDFYVSSIRLANDIPIFIKINRCERWKVGWVVGIGVIVYLGEMMLLICWLVIKHWRLNFTKIAKVVVVGFAANLVLATGAFLQFCPRVKVVIHIILFSIKVSFIIFLYLSIIKLKKLM